MKLTKQKLKQIIKEELTERTYNLGPFHLDVPSKSVSSFLDPILKNIGKAYDSLAPEDKEQFEKSLLSEINEYVEIWRARRQKGPQE